MNTWIALPQPHTTPRSRLAFMLRTLAAAKPYRTWFAFFGVGFFMHFNRVGDGAMFWLRYLHVCMWAILGRALIKT